MKILFCFHHDSFFDPWVIQKCPAVEESPVIFQFTGFQPNSMKVRECILNAFHPLKCVRFPADSGDVLCGDDRYVRGVQSTDEEIWGGLRPRAVHVLLSVVSVPWGTGFSG